ncbi:hypothetical protein H106_07897 [Trichophyton rubrum CBS 735.88]|nr:hypothetical protein H106_07897 [Trichophyton rubrum CBS 735.88]
MVRLFESDAYRQSSLLMLYVTLAVSQISEPQLWPLLWDATIPLRLVGLLQIIPLVAAVAKKISLTPFDLSSSSTSRRKGHFGSGGLQELAPWSSSKIQELKRALEGDDANAPNVSEGDMNGAIQ